MKKSTLIKVFTFCALPLLSTPGYADKAVEQAVEYRQAVMNVIAWNFKHMGAMVKGKTAFDQAAFAAYANELQAATRLNVLSGFPEDSDDSDETDAKAEIWMEWEDFQQKLKDLQQQADTLAKVAAAGDEEATKKQFGDTGKTCKACHKTYKE